MTSSLRSFVPRPLRRYLASPPEPTATGAAYGGLDLTTGSPFAGVEGRFSPPEAGTVGTVSLEAPPHAPTRRWQLNANGLVPLTRQQAPLGPPLAPYVGGGLCVVGGSAKEHVHVGVNLIVGASVRLGATRSYLQLRLTLADGVHLSLTGGAYPA